jgi:hypothetical protein
MLFFFHSSSFCVFILIFFWHVPCFLYFLYASLFCPSTCPHWTALTRAAGSCWFTKSWSSILCIYTIFRHVQDTAVKCDCWLLHVSLCIRMAPTRKLSWNFICGVLWKFVKHSDLVNIGQNNGTFTWYICVFQSLTMISPIIEIVRYKLRLQMMLNQAWVWLEALSINI